MPSGYQSATMLCALHFYPSRVRFLVSPLILSVLSLAN
jgi:hypothetical protein